MNVSVIVPWSGDDPARLHARYIVGRYFNDEFPHWQRQTAIDPAGPVREFSRARAINFAVSDPLGLRPFVPDVLVLNDADSIVPADQLRAAAVHAFSFDGIVFAYADYRRLSETDTATLTPDTYLDAFSFDVTWHQEGARSHGCVAIRRDVFLAAGGYDERYEGWGYEDVAFNAKGLPEARIGGPLVHLWHPEAEPNPANEALYLAEHG